VQWINLARLAHAPTPTMEALTTLASILNGIDYYAEGLTIDRMGMEDIAAQDVVKYAHEFPRKSRRPPRTSLACGGRVERCAALGRG
jgi:hypothetical protein